MIKTIIKKLNEFNLNDIVIAGHYDTENNQNCQSILDVRSAGFFSFGKALKEQKPVALIVNGDFLPNLLTSMTEAWFQKANVVIIAHYSHFNDVKCQYFERVVISLKTVENLSDDLIKESINKKGPVLINLVGFMDKEEKYDYGVISEVLQGERLFLYEPNKTFDNNDIKVINEKHKYGVVSRYMGMLAVSDKKIFLCCPVECVMTDLNVFNNRYSLKNTRIILFDKDNKIKQNRIDEWLISNDLKVVYSSMIDRDKVELVKNSSEPIVLVINGGIK